MRRFSALSVLLLGVSIGLGACGADFDPISYVDPATLRVLAVVADPPEAAAGATTTITAIVPPLADNTPVTFDWAICTLSPPPGTSQVADDCLKSDTGDFLIPIASTTATAQVTMPNLTDPTKLGIPDVTGGFYLPVRVRAHAGGQEVDTIYGLRLALPQLPANHNPVIQDLQQVDEPLDASPMQLSELSSDPANPTPLAANQKTTLRLTLTSDSYEMFPELQGIPPNQMVVMVSEAPRFFWYTDAGELSRDSTGQAQPDTVLDFGGKHPAAAGQMVHVWAVAQDERGGVVVTERYLVVH